ncbi:MAG TPA: DNA polymerase III subunit delta [Verrucomicrobiae bacterium]|nr:DNA polymerase III subunit delta [Verrucomicrobiae bacterium]
MPPKTKQKLPGPEELQKRLKKPDFWFLYLTGEEEFRMRRAVGHWETLLRAKHPNLKIKKLFGTELDWGELANYLSGLSLFGEIQLFWIFEADKLRQAVRESLTRVLENYSGPHYLLFWGEEADSRLNFTKLFAERNLLFKFTPFSKPEQVTGWLMGYASERGLAVSPDVAQMLVEKLGTDLSLLSSEIEKLALAYDKLPPKEQLEKEITSQRRFFPWDLADALAKKDAARALLVLKSLREEGNSPGTIFYQLTEHYSKLLALVLSGDFSLRTVQEWKFYGFLHPTVLAQAKTLSKDSVLAAIEKLASAERQTRFEKIEPELVLETTVVQLCQNS